MPNVALERQAPVLRVSAAAEGQRMRAPNNEMCGLLVGLLVWVAAGTANADAGEAGFAEVGLSRDAQAVLTSHLGAWFAHRSVGSEEGCVRGEAAPWLRAGRLPKGAHGYRQVAPAAAVETYVRSDGANITIVNWGCEYYTASVRFVFPLPQSAASPTQLVGRVADALRELQRVGAESVFDLAKVEAELRRHRDLAGLLRSGDEWPIPGDGEDFLQTRAVITRAGTVDGGTVGFVEFRLVKGPL